MASKPRIAYYTNESFAEDTPHGMVYWVVKVTENQPGYERAMPCNSQAKADEMAARRNAINGTREADVLDIVASSMRVSEIG